MFFLLRDEPMRNKQEFKGKFVDVMAALLAVPKGEVKAAEDRDKAKRKAHPRTNGRKPKKP
jgi:hypothetical protein